MPKVSFRMASASRESVFGVQTSTARKNHRSGHTEGRLTTTPSGCCVRKGPPYAHPTPGRPDRHHLDQRCCRYLYGENLTSRGLHVHVLSPSQIEIKPCQLL